MSNTNLSKLLANLQNAMVGKTKIQEEKKDEEKQTQTNQKQETLFDFKPGEKDSDKTDFYNNMVSLNNNSENKNNTYTACITYYNNAPLQTNIPYVAPDGTVYESKPDKADDKKYTQDGRLFTGSQDGLYYRKGELFTGEIYGLTYKNGVVVTPDKSESSYNSSLNSDYYTSETNGQTYVYKTEDGTIVTNYSYPGKEDFELRHDETSQQPGQPQPNLSWNDLLDVASEIKTISEVYADSMENKKLQLVYNLNETDVTQIKENLSYYSLILHPEFAGQYRVVNSDGDIVVSSVSDIPKAERQQTPDGYFYSQDGRKYIVMPDIKNTNYFQNGLREGAFVLQRVNITEELDADGNKTGKEYATWENTPWQGMDIIKDVLYTEDDAFAQSEYESKMAALSGKVEEYNKIANQYIDAEKLAEIEAEYKEKISNKILEFVYNPNGSAMISLSKELSYQDLMTAKEFAGQYRLVNSDGDIVVSSVSDIPRVEQKVPVENGDGIVEYKTVQIERQQASDGYFYSDDGRKYIVMPGIKNTNYFQNGLRDGAFVLQRVNIMEELDANGNKTGKEYVTWENTPWQGMDIIKDVLYTEDDALAEAQYEKKVSELKYEAILKAVQENTGEESPVSTVEPQPPVQDDPVLEPLVQPGDMGSIEYIEKLLGPSFNDNKFDSSLYDGQGRVILLKPYTLENPKFAGDGYSYSFSYGADGEITITKFNNVKPELSKQKESITEYYKDGVLKSTVKTEVAEDGTETQTKTEYSSNGVIRGNTIISKKDGVEISKVQQSFTNGKLYYEHETTPEKDTYTRYNSAGGVDIRIEDNCKDYRIASFITNSRLLDGKTGMSVGFYGGKEVVFTSGQSVVINKDGSYDVTERSRVTYSYNNRGILTDTTAPLPTGETGSIKDYFSELLDMDFKLIENAHCENVNGYKVVSFDADTQTYHGQSMPYRISISYNKTNEGYTGKYDGSFTVRVKDLQNNSEVIKEMTFDEKGHALNT